jgi:hypothetical protein
MMINTIGNVGFSFLTLYDRSILLVLVFTIALIDMTLNEVTNIYTHKKNAKINGKT